jgi:hypothetical protein
MEADAGGKACGAACEYELHRFDELGQGWEDDVVELPNGAGPAGAVECGAAVSVSWGDDGSEDGDAECSEWNECAGCSAGSEEPGATVSVSGRAAGGIVFFVEFRGCEAGAAGWVAGCGELGGEQLKLRLGLLEFQGG